MNSTKKLDKILVTAYDGPDLDGTAGALAYGEFLQKNHVDAVVGFYGTPQPEAQFVMQRLNISEQPEATTLVDEYPNIILVDASDMRGVSKKVDPNQVVELIDHRTAHRAHEFPNAKIQIELVGSACTLIAEKFHKQHVEISPESAAMLYSAIVSNTVNFKAGVTTDRDREMANWLLTKFDCPEQYIHNMFQYKSEQLGPLREQFFADFELGDKHLGVMQLEIIRAESFINEHLEEIQHLIAEKKDQGQLDVGFVTCIDIEKGFNLFVSFDETQKLLEEKLGVIFENNIAKREGVMMRKEIIPVIGAS